MKYYRVIETGDEELLNSIIHCLYSNNIEYRVRNKFALDPERNNQVFDTDKAILEIPLSFSVAAIFHLKKNGFGEYIEKDHRGVRLFLGIDNFTRKIWFLRKMRFYQRISVLPIVICISAVLMIILFWDKKPIKTDITERTWCIERIESEGKYIKPQTEYFFEQFDTGLCKEYIYFDSLRVTLPGFKSKGVIAEWELNFLFDSIFFYNSSAFQEIYNGGYKIYLQNKNEVVLKSQNTRIELKAQIPIR